MKKKYEQPCFEVTEFCFSEQIATSGGVACKYIKYKTNAYFDCELDPEQIDGQWGFWQSPQG